MHASCNVLIRAQHTRESCPSPLMSKVACNTFAPACALFNILLQTSPFVLVRVCFCAACASVLCVRACVHAYARARARARRGREQPGPAREGRHALARGRAHGPPRRRQGLRRGIQRTTRRPNRLCVLFSFSLLVSFSFRFHWIPNSCMSWRAGAACASFFAWLPTFALRMSFLLLVLFFCWFFMYDVRWFCCCKAKTGRRRSCLRGTTRTGRCTTTCAACTRARASRCPKSRATRSSWRTSKTRSETSRSLPNAKTLPAVAAAVAAGAARASAPRMRPPIPLQLRRRRGRQEHRRNRVRMRIFILFDLFVLLLYCLLMKH